MTAAFGPIRLTSINQPPVVTTSGGTGRLTVGDVGIIRSAADLALRVEAQDEKMADLQAKLREVTARLDEATAREGRAEDRAEATLGTARWALRVQAITAVINLLMLGVNGYVAYSNASAPPPAVERSIDAQDFEEFARVIAEQLHRLDDDAPTSK